MTMTASPLVKAVMVMVIGHGQKVPMSHNPIFLCLVYKPILLIICRRKDKSFAKILDNSPNFSYICNLKHKKQHNMGKFMDLLTARIMANDGLNETEAKAKLNLIYIKMNQSEIKEFVDEFTEWLMTEKKLNYKAILQTPDRQLHDIYETEFQH